MKRILVVDDRDEVRRALAGLLASEGYEVMEATDGLQVPDKVRKFRPDLIMLDIIMPVMDGFEVLKMLKKDPQTQSIPVIVVSAASTGANVERARLLGAADFLVKSASPDQVLARVRAALPETPVVETK
jgi:CheY-like chemotaxis protein